MFRPEFVWDPERVCNAASGGVLYMSEAGVRATKAEAKAGAGIDEDG